MIEQPYLHLIENAEQKQQRLKISKKTHENSVLDIEEETLIDEKERGYVLAKSEEAVQRDSLILMNEREREVGWGELREKGEKRDGCGLENASIEFATNPTTKRRWVY